MTTFEFVSVLLSIVVSLALAHLLTAFARMAKAKNLKLSWVLIGWMGVAMFGCLDFWFSLWQARDVGVWSFGYVMLWLLMATALYMMAWLVAPEGELEGRDLHAGYLADRRKFLIAYAAYLLGAVLINMSLQVFYDLVSWLVALWFLPLIAAWIWANKWVQFAALAVTLALTARYVASYMSTL